MLDDSTMTAGGHVPVYTYKPPKRSAKTTTRTTASRRGPGLRAMPFCGRGSASKGFCRSAALPPPLPLAPQVCYGAFSPLALSDDEDTRNMARALAIDQRQESRLLAQAKDSWERLKRWVSETNRKGEARTHYSAE